MSQKVVFVGLSGGVDSSLTAYLLLQQGYKVVGVYMKNWTQDIGLYQCPWKEDYLAAKQLATFLNIKLLVFDFQTEYKDLVVDYMLEEYAQGRTPNPDIRCNQTVKFDLFFKASIKAGADLIATGHYAKTDHENLYKATDQTKDQTYFLYRVPKESLKKTLFPLGKMLKREVRQLASQLNLPTAQRAESMGLCFVGSVGMVNFLKNYAQTQPGDIINDQGQIIGQHQGAIFYTLGQRHGLNIGGGLPYYVTGKNMTKNQVYVSQNLNHPKFWATSLKLRLTHWLVKPQKNLIYQVRIRHLGALYPLQINLSSNQSAELRFKQPIKTTAQGQSAVLYQDNLVLGGGIIAY
ncbi:MAG: tRNA 2-thiouridine(34) synthase MnmA [Candidatus Saccharibacteria bacterium]|nr:tRNA 2-thiouridine(34) synthase MnmA [Candidatus Saccharibacteria bacterium]